LISLFQAGKSSLQALGQNFADTGQPRSLAADTAHSARPTPLQRVFLQHRARSSNEKDQRLRGDLPQWAWRRKTMHGHHQPPRLSRRQRSCAAEKKNVQPVTRKLSLVLQSDNDRNNRFAFSIGIWD
jgi:hypothetical protein